MRRMGQAFLLSTLMATFQSFLDLLRLGVETFENYFRENKTIFADAPQNLMPVVLNSYSNNTHSDVVGEIEAFVDEFQASLER